MKKIRIGITGQSGFVGTHLYNTLGQDLEFFERIYFENDFFKNDTKLDEFVSKCDVIVHLAAMNRHNDSNVIYKTNIELVNKIIDALERTNSKPHIYFSSSTQEENDNLYGKSKKDGRLLFIKWAREKNALFTGMLIPNVFGPFGLPYYNSVVATFAYQITHGEKPEIHVDNEIKLIYIAELVDEIIKQIKQKKAESKCEIRYTIKIKVSKILALLENFKEVYMEKLEVPVLLNRFELNLFNTFICYIDIKDYYPVSLTKHTDSRGSFIEIIRVGVGGQTSISTTVPNVIRGNHYHTRKIERFAVIKGKALIQMRRIGTEDIFNFYLNGDTPAYVDMPIWYTHSIKNIGKEELYTVFWINEPYNPKEPDTYFVKV